MVSMEGGNNIYYLLLISTNPIIDINNATLDINNSIFGGRVLWISRIALLMSIIGIIDINNAHYPPRTYIPA